MTSPRRVLGVSFLEALLVAVVVATAGVAVWAVHRVVAHQATTAVGIPLLDVKNLTLDTTVPLGEPLTIRVPYRGGQRWGAHATTHVVLEDATGSLAGCGPAGTSDDAGAADDRSVVVARAGVATVTCPVSPGNGFHPGSWRVVALVVYSPGVPPVVAAPEGAVLRVTEP